MWERTLQDLIRGLRANKGEENKFIQRAIDEIRKEVKSKDMHLKAAAVLKLTYLDMLGYDMAWASFYVVEVMSSPKYHLKNVGHLAACQSFTKQTDVLMLTTNLLKKELSAPPQDLTLALNTLSHILTPDLARDLAQDLIPLLTHSRAQIRKRAVVTMFNICQQYPEILPHAFNRMRVMLDDPDPGVVVAAVNVIMELSRKDPSAYLNLAPQLFHLLTTSSNNWVLIKTMKIFACLAPLEPRLVKKLQAPMADLISSTSAISLLYECVRTCITGGMLSGATGHALARSCVDKLAGFLQNEDQNLKYIALLALLELVPSHPHMVAEHEEAIMASIDEPDISIRMRALSVVSAMATMNNFQSLVGRLLAHLVPSSTPLQSAASALASVQSPTGVPAPQHNAAVLTPSYRAHLTQLILSLGSRDMYSLVSDFNWYLSVLADLTYVSKAPHVGPELARQMLDIAVRVRASRRFAVDLMTRLLGDENLLLRTGDEDGCPEVLAAAAWICGEFCAEAADRKVLMYYLVRAQIASLPAGVLAVYLHAALKVYGFWAAELVGRWEEGDAEELGRIVDMITGGIEPFVASEDIEVQERATNALQLFTFIRADLSSYKPSTTSDSIPAPPSEPSSTAPSYPKSLLLIQPLFASAELNALSPGAQAGVPVPQGLNLDEWIVPPQPEDPDDVDELELAVDGGEPAPGRPAKKVVKKKKVKKAEAAVPETPEERAERERRRAERLERQKDDPFYIQDSKSKPKPPPQEDDVDGIPVVRLEGLSLPPLASLAGPSSSQPPPQPKAAPSLPVLAGAISEEIANDEEKLAEPLLPEATPKPQPAQELVSSSTSSLVQYDGVDEGVDTPEPIRVTRPKKGTKKKKAVVDTV